MADTTFRWTKAISNQVFLPTYFKMLDSDFTWDVKSLYTERNMKFMEEAIFGIYGMGAAVKTKELDAFAVGQMGELPSSTLTTNKWTLGRILSTEAVDFSNAVDQVRITATALARGHNHSFEYDGALPFVNAFDSTYALYDGVEMCGTHTLKDGSSLVNFSSPMDLSPDSLWNAINYFTYTAKQQDGLPYIDKAAVVVYHPSKEQRWQETVKSAMKAFEQSNTKNVLPTLRGVPCQHIDSAAWFVLGAKAKENMHLGYAGQKNVFVKERDETVDGWRILVRRRYGFLVSEYVCVYGVKAS